MRCLSLCRCCQGNSLAVSIHPRSSCVPCIYFASERGPSTSSMKAGLDVHRNTTHDFRLPTAPGQLQATERGWVGVDDDDDDAPSVPDGRHRAINHRRKSLTQLPPSLTHSFSPSCCNSSTTRTQPQTSHRTVCYQITSISMHVRA